MDRFTLYKHRNCTDTALMPVAITPVKDYLIVKVQWFNVTGEKPWFMGLKETVRIKLTDVPNWVKI